MATVASLILLLNVAVLVPGSLLCSNEFLKFNSWLFYAAQALTMVPWLWRATLRIRDIFLPSTIVLAYQLFSMVPGACLAPRGYGHYSGYAQDLAVVDNYRLIVAYILLANAVLFALSCKYLLRGELRADGVIGRMSLSTRQEFWIQISCALVFFFAGKYQVFSAFSFQLAAAIVSFGIAAANRRLSRWVLYPTYVVVAALYAYESKREVVVVVLAALLCECCIQNWRLRLSVKNLLRACVLFPILAVVILTTSVMRGYGGFEVKSVSAALAKVPDYIRSDGFLDGITDNLEFSYSYGAAVVSLEYILDGKIDFQFGKTIIKPLFLPVSREFFPGKPESLMQIYTAAYSQAWADEGGSLPVALTSEMFANAHFGGLGILWILVSLLNSFYIKGVARRDRLGAAWFSTCFLVLLVPFLARGSGLDQYVLYFTVAAPFIVVMGFAIRLRDRERKLQANSSMATVVTPSSTVVS